MMRFSGKAENETHSRILGAGKHLDNGGHLWLAYLTLKVTSRRSQHFQHIRHLPGA